MQKGAPFIFFTFKRNLQNRTRLKGTPFRFFSALCGFFRKKKVFKNFKFFCTKSVLRFLSLRYSAYYRPSRFVFLQTTDLTLIGPLFGETPETTKAKSGQGKLSAKGPPFRFLLF